MYLKSIEVQGFKSFANKIVFEFHNGITGIVGPNGSGKSNVADAVRWVLGEQRVKQLRGASMQDVIFSGTEMRKPQGFAYVAITLDNSDHQLAIDYEQVTVARRIYRSGESEYLLNGSACRLKDIYELFYDTGIGKEGYSIIGQGQIDKILSGKPEDRRELFDEAAGIVKFKRRKNIAVKKLEDEHQNMVRVEDILAELEKQVGPLKKQSETAREYLRLREELKTYEVNLFLNETETLKTQLADLTEKEGIVSADLAETRGESDQIRTTYEELDASIAALSGQIEELRGKRNMEEVLKGNLEGQINVLLEQIKTEQLNAEHLAQRIGAIDRDVAERQEQIDKYRADNADIAVQTAESEKKQEEAEEELRRADERIMLLDAKIEGHKSNIITNLNERASLTARQQHYLTMLEQVQVRHSEVAQRLLRIKSDESAQAELKEAAEAELARIGETIEVLSRTREECEEQIAGLENEGRSLNRSLNEKQQEYRAGTAKLESLRNIAERYDGYGGSIRRVMEAHGREKGVYGVVADLITTKKEYETALETALGGSIQNIVTDTETTAKQLIEFLKRNRYGRATFLPLDSIGRSGSFGPKEALREPGVLGLASDLAEADGRFTGLVEYLLGRVVVTDNIDHAIALARKYKHSLRIVTLEGELLSAGGSMTGGSFKNNSNLLGRRREIEELEGLCGKLERDVKKLQSDLELNEGQLTEKREELQKLRDALQKTYLEQNTVQMNMAQLDEKIQEIADSGRDLVIENQQLEEQVLDLRKNQQELSADVKGLEDQNEQANQDIESLTKRLEEERGRREELAGALAEIRLETANLQQKYSFVLENVGRVNEEIRRLREEKAQLSEGSHDTDAVIGEKSREIEELKGHIQASEEHAHTLEAEIEKCSAGREEQTAKQKGLFEKREELSERLARLDKEQFRLQSQQEKVNERLDRHVDYMWSEYELTFTTAEALRNPELRSVPEMRKRTDQLRADIKALGNVNVNAIEDYKEVSERYEFMNAQHEDLARAEATLQQIITELDEGMRKQFTEKFGEIRREFDKVFKELFGGGHGTLELVEDEDILEAGIQIIAQPPGKKLQNMMQLSGGEKALTAISLLFAIQNLKPSPFCLLDEIEAALDESNVDRFARYLHKLSKNTQFIVITHRRGTMVSADRLYGITMQEKGVSALVSVNLIEDTLDN